MFERIAIRYTLTRFNNENNYKICGCNVLYFKSVVINLIALRYFSVNILLINAKSAAINDEIPKKRIDLETTFKYLNPSIFLIIFK